MSEAFENTEKHKNGHIRFSVKGESGEQIEMLRLESSGDIFVKGKLAENDKDVVQALRDYLAYHWTHNKRGRS